MPTEKELKERWRTMTLIAISCVRGGASLPGLTKGLGVIPPEAVSASVLGLERDGLIYRRTEGRVERFYLPPDVTLSLR